MPKDDSESWLTVRLPREQFRELTILAAMIGTNRSDLVRRVLVDRGLPYARELASSTTDVTPAQAAAGASITA